MTRRTRITTTDTWSLDWSSYVSEATRLSAVVRRIELSGREQPFVGTLNEEINDGLLVLTHRFDQRWSATAGIGGYNGASSDHQFSWSAGALLRSRSLSSLPNTRKNRPWTDPAQAVRHDGAFDRLQLTLDWNDGKRHRPADPGGGLVLPAWTRRIRTAARRTVLGFLSWRLLPDPEIVVGYSYYRSWFDYERDDYRPLVLVEDQAWHGVFGSFLHRPWDDWTWGVSGGWRYDHIRNLNGWYIQPNFNVFLANRLELFGMYEYSRRINGSRGGRKPAVSGNDPYLFLSGLKRWKCKNEPQTRNTLTNHAKRPDAGPAEAAQVRDHRRRSGDGGAAGRQFFVVFP